MIGVMRCVTAGQVFTEPKKLDSAAPSWVRRRIGDAPHHGRYALGKNALRIVFPALLRICFLGLAFSPTR